MTQDKIRVAQVIRIAQTDPGTQGNLGDIKIDS